MRSLLSLLEEAVNRAASEVTIESGQPVVYMTARGTEAETEVLPSGDLFDMIVAAVNESQQVELAVGNPVEFELEASGVWTVFAEPGLEGIRVRASRPPTREPSLDIQLDYSAGAPNDFGMDPVPDIDSGALEFGPAEFSASETSDSDPLTSRPDEISADFHQRAPDSAVYESGTWALEDDDEFDIGSGPLPDDDSLPTGLFDDDLSEEDAHIGVPDDDDEEEFDPFGGGGGGPAYDADRRHTLSPTVRAMDAAEQREPPASAVTERELSVRMHAATETGIDAVSASERATMRSMKKVSLAGRATISEAPRRKGHDTGRRGSPMSGLDALALDISEGTLVLIRELGYADALAAAFSVRHVTFDDSSELEDVSLMLRNAQVGTIVIIRREDPSAVLGWILRRLEEGCRVFVESRARSVEGARRVLLGVHATARAERWLESHNCVAVEIAAEGPVLVQA